VLSHDVLSHHSTPDTRQPISPDAEALRAAVSVPPTYIPCRLSEQRRWLMTGHAQPLITSTNGLDAVPEPGSSTRSW
jgi:hypothetical protein